MSAHDTFTDDDIIEAFVRRLAKAEVYNSYDTGDCLSVYWKEQAQAWLEHWEKEGVK